MKRLPERFKKNGIRYRLYRRTESVAMYALLALYSDAIVGYEVFTIPIRNDQYGIREVIPSNSEFGIMYDSQFFGGRNKLEMANKHFESLHHLVKGLNKTDQSILTPI